MAWIEAHDDIWEHPKTIKLSKKLGITLIQTAGHLLSLWHFTLRNAWENADLTEWGDDGIEAAARWDGKPGVFVKALRDVGSLDGSIVHGWMMRAGSLVYDRLRKRQERSKNVQDNSRTKLGLSEATVPYRTVPNSTDKDVTQNGACGQVDKSVDKCEFYSEAEGRCDLPKAARSKFCPHHLIKFTERKGGGIPGIRVATKKMP